MRVQRFQVIVGGKPVRFHKNRDTKCIYHDEPINQFSVESDAHKKAASWNLIDYEVKPVTIDIGTPTNLTEIRF